MTSDLLSFCSAGDVAEAEKAINRSDNSIAVFFIIVLLKVFYLARNDRLEADKDKH